MCLVGGTEMELDCCIVSKLEDKGGIYWHERDLERGEGF